MIKSLREEAQPVYLSLRFGEPMPLWAVYHFVASFGEMSLTAAHETRLEDMRQYLAVVYAQMRTVSGNVIDDAVRGREDVLRACHAAVVRAMEEEGEGETCL